MLMALSTMLIQELFMRWVITKILLEEAMIGTFNKAKASRLGGSEARGFEAKGFEARGSY